MSVHVHDENCPGGYALDASTMDRATYVKEWGKREKLARRHIRKTTPKPLPLDEQVRNLQYRLTLLQVENSDLRRQVNEAAAGERTEETA